VLGAGGLIAAIPVLRTASPADFGLGGIAIAFAGLLLAGIGHEVAHALAAKAEGVRIGRAGIGLFWFAPVVYVDTSLAWAIPRWARIRVNAAGPLFNLAVAGLFALSARFASGTAQDVLVWLALTNVVLVVFNLSPLLEFDGYYVLADLTDTNALRRKAMRSVFRDLGRPRPPASRREAGYLAYTVAAIAYVLAMSAVAIAGSTSAVRALLPSWIGDAERAGIGAAIGAVLAVMLVLPFAGEALEARRPAEPGRA
jgi:putative peptide zinc metalloprotease protein